jgi:hypothetical protein
MKKSDLDLMLKANKLMNKKGIKEELILQIKSLLSKDKKAMRQQIALLEDKSGVRYNNIYGYLFYKKSCSANTLLDFIEMILKDKKNFG